MKNILDYSLEELKIWMKENNESEFRAKQVFDWLYKGAENYEQMKNISPSSKEKLSNFFYIGFPNIETQYKSKNSDTIKFLFGFLDGNLIESVVMKHVHGNTICISTQVGCRMGCSFCASTLGGVIRNLTAGEMLSQVIKAQNEVGERISNIVLMGSGEPLDNFDEVLKFLSLIHAPYGLNIGHRHITLSTCGIVPKILELADKNLQITLAISLHAPNDVLRKTMMPIANKYNLNELLDACKYYIEKTNRRITFEYALVKDVNDSVDCAQQLCKLLKGLLCHVNLIPVNEIKEKSFSRSSSDRVKAFSNILTNCGLETTIRKEMGIDINAACGQLRRSYMNKQNT